MELHSKPTENDPTQIVLVNAVDRVPGKEPYSTLLRAKLAAALGGKFAVKEALKDFTGTMTCYVMCQHDVRMPCSYETATLVRGRPLQFKLSVKCGLCLCRGLPPIPRPQPAPPAPAVAHPAAAPAPPAPAPALAVQNILNVRVRNARTAELEAIARAFIARLRANGEALGDDELLEQLNEDYRQTLRAVREENPPADAEDVIEVLGSSDED